MTTWSLKPKDNTQKKKKGFLLCKTLPTLNFSYLQFGHEVKCNFFKYWFKKNQSNIAEYCAFYFYLKNNLSQCVLWTIFQSTGYIYDEQDAIF